MARPVIIAGNWKMHKTIQETKSFLEALLPALKKTNKQVYIAPPFTAIHAAAEVATGSILRIGGQNMSDADEGAFTGEISAKMLKEAGAQFVILGHSERRAHFGETDEHIHHKLKRAIGEKLPPILCIGESLKEREEGHSIAVLKKQLDGAHR